MALDEADFERIGKLIDNAISRRMALFEQDYHADHIALIQEMQASEKRLRSEMQASEMRLRGEMEASEMRLRGDMQALEQRLQGQISELAKDVSAMKTDIATLQTKLAEVQQWVSRIFNEHGIALGKISDTIDGLYRRDFTLDQRLNIVEAWMRMRQLPPSP